MTLIEIPIGRWVQATCEIIEKFQVFRFLAEIAHMKWFLHYGAQAEERTLVFNVKNSAGRAADCG